MPSTSLNSPIPYFKDHLAFTITKANILLPRNENDASRIFLENYTERATPCESTLRKVYMREKYRENENSVKQEIADQFFDVIIDETTDAQS